MRKIQFTYPIVMFAIAGLSACSVNEEPVPVNPSGTGEIALSAQKMHIITRSGDEIERFDVDTKYWLYGIEDNQWTEGTEIANHTIDFRTVISFSDDPMDFYGVTYGTEDIPKEDNLSSEHLTITEKVRENNELSELPDLMFSNNLQGQTANNGYRLEMDFKHAMSKLKFMIAKQDETGDEEKKLEEVKLEKIVVKGTHSSGTLNIKSESWSYSSEDKISDRTFVKNLSQEIKTTSEEVPGEMLIFPNQKNEKVTISVTLSGLGSELNSKPIDYDLKEVDEEGNETGNFQFEMNHQYTLLITVLKDDVRVIAIAPQVYEWLDVDKDNYLGQPVTFGNLMWMDRNIGAESADCYNEWEKCRGYYYQYARNLPYILDKDKYDNAENKVPVYPFLYTYNQDGEKVYGGLQVNSTKELEDGTQILVRGRNNIAVYPGDDKPIYEFIYDNGNGIWMYDKTESKEDVFINSFWTSGAENHPCPKGWRLPTKEDFATFLPDLTITAPWSKVFHTREPYEGKILKYREEIRYGSINGEKAMYVIKRQGRPDCYRIRLLMKESKEEGKWYFEIAQFPGDQSMTFEGLDTEEQFIASMNDGTFDWTTPSAVIEIPACGFIHPQGGNKLNGDGTNAILRSSDYNGSGTNWVFYLRDDDWQCGLINGSRKALGDQIRCVRDVTVNK